MNERIKNVAEKRLLLKNAEGKVIEDITGMYKRVATYLSSSEEEYESFFELMNGNYFLPNSPCLVNAGTENRDNQLAACFVLDVPDSIAEIYDRLKESALIAKGGGGVGFNFSDIRPANALVKSTHGIASGPVSFMKIFNSSTDGLKQGGTRRGANMGVLRVDHPDIEDFISCKRDGVTLQNFNISVAVTQAFMQALIERRNYDLIDPHTKEIVNSISAKHIFDMIVDNSWLTGDPGVLFIDRINDHNPLTGANNYIAATNPCGEEPLAPRESCCLGSINLAAMVNANGVYDYDKLRQVAMRATLFLNRMMTKSVYPNPEITKRVIDSAKIGLGSMGFADALIMMKIPYTSEEAINFAASAAQTILDASVAATHRLGQEEGTFKLFNQYVAPKHIKHALQRESIPEDTYTPANSTITTSAPTGTISILADCSSGIEPVFYLEQIENRADAVITHRHPLYEIWRAKHPEITKPGYFQDLHDIDAETHINIQSTFQRFICSGVSKTVNLPNSATRDEVAQIIHNAFYTGCKGTTIYRDGSKVNQVISDGSKPQQAIGHRHAVIMPVQRPEILEGKTYQIRTGYGDMLVTINSNQERPFEVICQLGKSGASSMAKAEAISRLVSILLRCSVDTETIIKQLDGIVGGNPTIGKHGTVHSIPDALAKIMKLHTDTLTDREVPAMMLCVECQSKNLQAEGSCLKCLDCGWKSCS
jgi:ribonucleoside-diphosphate reductase alpha chain